MATKLFARLPDVRGVPIAGQSNTVRVNIPPIGRLLNIKGNVIQGTVPAPLAAMKTAIGDVRLILNTEVVRKWRFSETVAQLSANGYPVEDGLFAIFLAEPWRATVLDEELLALQMGGVYNQVSLEFELTQPATPFEFDFAYEYDMTAKTLPNGQLMKGILGHEIQVENVGGGEPIIKLNPIEGALQRAWIVVPATVNVDRIRLVQGLSTFYDRWNTAARPEIARSLKDMGLSIPANFTNANGTFKMVPLVLDNNQRLANNIANLAGMNLQLTLSAPADVRILIEQQILR